MASHFSIGFLLFILAYCFSYSSAAVATLWQEEFKMEMEAKMNQLIEMKTVQFEVEPRRDRDKMLDGV